jgi:hypothetical protein
MVIARYTNLTLAPTVRQIVEIIGDFEAPIIFKTNLLNDKQVTEF